ncbi:hypothetical protein [Alienimonas sp. DA493]|uniref:hypothetical protein n=1 Tax=Alienimonas sp. DA493 TaxID=3373605 RepID=UPI003754039A
MAERTLRCTECGARVVPHDEHGVEFRCPACGAVAVTTDRDAPVRIGQRGDLKRLHGVDLAKFTIDLNGPSLLVSWRWNRLAGAAVLTVAVLVGAAALFFALPLTREDGPFELRGESLFGLGLSGIFLLALHRGLALALNRTEIAVHDGTLRVWHGPIPRRLSRRVPLSELDELRVWRKVRSDGNGGQRVTWELHAVRQDGKWVRLIADESRRSTPAAVKRLLDAHLDRAVRPERAAPTCPTPARVAPVDSVDSAEALPAVTLSCPQCGGTLDPPPERAETTCRFCSATAPIPTEVQRVLALRPARTPDRARLRATFAVRQEGDATTFSAAWPREVATFLLRVALAAGAFAALGGVVANWTEFDLFWLLLTAAAAGGTAWAGYVGLCYRWNRTTLTVTREEFRVVQGPLPWAWPAVLPTARVTQLVVRKEDVFRGWRGETHWTLLALADHGANLALFGQIPDREALETLEQLVERRLGIRDQAVRG